MHFIRLRITTKYLFLFSWMVLFASRILVLTDNYSWPINPVWVEVIYLFAATLFILVRNNGRVKLNRGKSTLVLLLLLLHTLLWGVVFVDQRFDDLITSNFKSQIMFVVIVWVTVLAVYQFDTIHEFLKCCYYTLGIMLTSYFLNNISELDLSNLANIMTLSDRTRANFGFGHYNTLGSACMCGIVLREVVKKERRTFAIKVIDYAILAVMVCMLLGSASRSALTSVVVYYLVYYSLKMKEWPISKNMIRTMKVISIFLIGIVAVWALMEVDIMEFLIQAQRAMIFTHALPMFFTSGKTWLGLGYASNVAYATKQTPYITYWLDNAYAYYLITTGIIGFVLIMIALFAIGLEVKKRIDKPLGRETMAVYIVYVYISLFECILFSSGSIVNYVYVPWLLLYIMNKRGKEGNI